MIKLPDINNSDPAGWFKNVRDRKYIWPYSYVDVNYNKTRDTQNVYLGHSWQHIY